MCVGHCQSVLWRLQIFLDIFLINVIFPNYFLMIFYQIQSLLSITDLILKVAMEKYVTTAKVFFKGDIFYLDQFS